MVLIGGLAAELERQLSPVKPYKKPLANINIIAFPQTPKNKIPTYILCYGQAGVNNLEKKFTINFFDNIFLTKNFKSIIKSRC